MSASRRVFGILCVLTAAVSASAQDVGRPAGGDGLAPVEIDALTPYAPESPRPEEAEASTEALAAFGAGRVKELRGDPAGAIEAYRRAIELAPGVPAFFRSLVTLAFNNGRADLGAEYGMKLVELQPENYAVAFNLGRALRKSNLAGPAAEFMAKAVASPGLEKRSAESVAMHAELAATAVGADRMGLAADGFALVMAALADPAGYGLDAAATARLLGDAVATYGRMGDVFIAAKRTDDAVTAFERAADVRTGEPEVLHYDLARTYLAGERPGEAVAAMEEYLRLGGTARGMRAYRLLERALTAAGRGGEYRDVLRDAVEGDPRNNLPRVALGLAEVAAGEAAAAEIEFATILAFGPEANALIGLAGVSRLREDGEAQLAALAEGLARKPDDTVLDAELVATAEDEGAVDRLVAAGRARTEEAAEELPPAGWLMLAKFAQELGRVDDAVAFYRELVDMETPGGYAVAVELGEYLFSEGRFGEAAEVFTEQLTRDTLEDSARVELWLRLAQAEAADDEAVAAVAAVDRAATLAPANALVLLQQGLIRGSVGRYAEAIELLGKYVERFKGQGAPVGSLVRQARLSLSNMQLQSGDESGALATLEELYEENPGDVSVNNDLGYLYAEAGVKLEKALGMTRLAVAAEPDSAAYLDSLGWVLFKLGRYDEAVAELRKAVDAPDGREPVLLDHLGDALAAAGDEAGAAEAWREALELIDAETEATTQAPPGLEASLREKLGLDAESPADGGGDADEEAVE